LVEWVGPGFFERPTLDVAADLIGRVLRVTSDAGETRGTIVETEAYGGPDDPASHAAFKPKGRAAVMFGPPGVVYVYAAYGVYPCLNIVTETEGTPGAILIRGVWVAGTARPTLGPGRVTRLLGVTLDDHGLSLDGGRIAVSTSRRPARVEQTARIGITRGVETPWRFVASALEQDAPDGDSTPDGRNYRQDRGR
jgi:DNA-3-methyladenine glycosylase